MEDTKKVFAFTLGKENILPATVIRKRTTIASLEERIIQEQDALKEEQQGQHSEPSRSSTTLLLVFSPIESHLAVQSRRHLKHMS
jgi:hypothetical protein